MSKTGQESGQLFLHKVEYLNKLKKRITYYFDKISKRGTLLGSKELKCLHK